MSVQDDMYSGYEDGSSPLSETVPAGRPLESSRGRTPGARGGTALRQSRLGTSVGRAPATSSARVGTAIEEGARPVTAVKGAGYVSTNSSPGRKQDSSGYLSRQKDPSPTEQITALEAEVHELLETAVENLRKGEANTAREFAQKAQGVSEELQTRSEALGLQDSVNLDLQYAVRVCQAHCTQAAGIDQEALAMYSSLARNQEFLMGGRIRVNMGNMFAKRGQWTDAIKQYRMALDQIPSERQGIYSDARDNFEAVLRIRPDMVSAYNRLIATYMITKSVEQSDALKLAFQDMLCVPGLAQVGADKSHGCIEGSPESELETSSQMTQAVVTAAKLIAPHLHPTDPSAGFEWCLEELLKAKLAEIAHDVMMAKAHYFLRSADMDEAASVLKQFERHGGSVRIKAATNLSFLHSLEGNLSDATRYSDLVMSHDEYHVQALVNAGNCKLEQGLKSEATREEDVTAAWALYEAALKQEPDCIEAIFNMSLAAKAMEQYDLALEQLIMLNGLMPNQVEVLYQIADLYLLKGDHKRARKMLHLTYDFVGSEPGLMARLGNISATMSNREESLQYMLEAHDQCPNIDTLAVICTQYTNDEKYGTAARFFQQAALLQPSEPKWMLMVASCYRRSQKYEQAMGVYEKVHEQHPDNREALKFLVQLAGELQDETKRVKYETALTKVERVIAMQEHVPRPTSKQFASGGNSLLPLHGNNSAGFDGQPGLASDEDLLPDPATIQRMTSKIAQAEDVGSPVDMIGVGLLPGLD